MNFLKKDGHSGGDDKALYLDSCGHITALKDGKRYITSFGGIVKKETPLTFQEGFEKIFYNGGTLKFKASGKDRYLYFYAPFKQLYQAYTPQGGTMLILRSVEGLIASSAGVVGTSSYMGSSTSLVAFTHTNGSNQFGLLRSSNQITFNEKVDGVSYNYTSEDITEVKYIPLT